MSQRDDYAELEPEPAVLPPVWGKMVPALAHEKCCQMLFGAADRSSAVGQGEGVPNGKTSKTGEFAAICGRVDDGARTRDVQIHNLVL